MATEKIRCPWAELDDVMRKYHDTEWGIPQHAQGVLFEYIVLDSFQAGLSWATILKKRENFRKAFDSFDPAKIAKYDNKKVEALLKNAGIIRHRGKIEATIGNAKVFLEIQKEFGGFDSYLWQWVGNTPKQNSWKTEKSIPAKTELSDLVSYDLKKRGFRFFGSTICYAFMQGAGLVNDHVVFCFRWREVQRKR
ncbi:MAG TPA: DNA-3-methyladenine glycosylase I [Candidatus Paceibacterota bacterium]